MSDTSTNPISAAEQQTTPARTIFPQRFVFSQSSLQDFQDCRRRFQLRHLQKISWPALQAEPALENERLIQRGDRFHRLAQQYLLGLPAHLLARMAEADPDPLVANWWTSFVDRISQELSGRRYVERSLRATAGPPPLDTLTLMAIFDLILLHDDGRVLIFDWKTSAHRPKRQWLAQRLQTRIYPYLLVQAGACLTGGRAIDPDQIEMVYWFADPQHAPERFVYSSQQYRADEAFLQTLIHTIRALPQDGYSMAASEMSCRYCNFRSLCNRGIQAGPIDAEAMAGIEAQPEALDFDLDQIGEIAF